MSDDLKERVDNALDEFVGNATSGLRDLGDELSPVADAASEFVLDAGKRLRPAFCYWGALYAGAPDSDALVRAAASLELLQACALVHDDVIDHSDTRRGRPAVHRRFASLHDTAGWAGDADDFGAAAAILLGDVLLAWSEEMFATSGLHDEALRRAQPVSAKMRTEVMAGQYLDIVEQARGATTVERALRVARLKSAKYTVERPLHLGAAIAGADPAYAETFTRFGIPVGEAFQLNDDMLGVFGDPTVTGKPAGDDLREGKQTVLTALALERASDQEAELLRASLGRPDLGEEAIDHLRRIIRDSGAADEVMTMITARLSDAHDALNDAPVASTETQRAGRSRLIGLASAAAGFGKR
ncbi:MAG TPA: polyprenyl synthetase family protein [Mycobacteriales bacterium]|nr:polyprenyl synthetase family protein [Mycobacteriales bacterium]